MAVSETIGIQPTNISIFQAALNLLFKLVDSETWICTTLKSEFYFKFYWQLSRKSALILTLID